MSAKRGFLLSLVAVAACLGAALSQVPGGRNMQAQNAGEASIVVYADKTEGTLDPRLFGEFSEIIYNSMDGVLGAEKIRSRGFENPDDNVDGVSDPWVPIVEEGAQAEFARDPELALVHFCDYPANSQRIRVIKPGLVGIAQRRVAIKEGEELELSLWLRQEGLQGAVVAFLADAERREVYCRERFSDIPGQWKRYTCRMTAPKSNANAALAIVVEGAGTVWVDQVSLMPTDAVHGYKREVRDIFKELAPATIRIPGGNFAQHYHWTDGIGPRDFRPAVPNYSWGCYMEPNNIGTDEMLRFWQEEIGAQAIICINIGDTGGQRPKPNNSTARALRDAVNWLEYCNGPVDSEWGAKRAENGHPEPYNVKLWEIGNEIGYGHITGQLDAATYARRVVQFARALKEKDPKIEIIASGLMFNEQWNVRLAREAGEWIDYIALHMYYGSPEMRDLLAQPLNFERRLRRIYRQINDNAPQGKEIKIAFNEWAPSAQHGTRPNAIDAALYATAMLHAFMRLHDVVAMQAVTDAWIHIRVAGNDIWTTPTYEAMKLQYRHHGDKVLACDVRCATFDAPTQGKGIPLLDVVATRSDGRLYISVLNKGPEAIAARVRISGAQVGAGAAYVISAPLSARNTRATPRAIVVKEGEAPPAEEEFVRTFPGFSATVLEFALR